MIGCGGGGGVIEWLIVRLVDWWWVYKVERQGNLPNRSCRIVCSHGTCHPLLITTYVTLPSQSRWDDPRLPTIKAMRRRGYTPDAMKAFALSVGITRNDQMIEFERLEFFVRKDLNDRALRCVCWLACSRGCAR